ncbi:MAG: hypothetical protein IT204_08000 [Fimbriimonadaceae bacterium]|nr:hypothetical protein [Fimbriimonadaceae bacterium]
MLTLCLAVALLASPPGRFATLSVAPPTGLRQTANSTFTLDLEKVLKFHAIAPRRTATHFGELVYAGSLALRGARVQWSYALPDGARETSVSWPAAQRCVVQ